ncbi:MAG: response regulator [Calditrichaeota bacterium]|nr:MAG: response regulator [Calditrichota bacterium]
MSFQKSIFFIVVLLWAQVRAGYTNSPLPKIQTPEMATPFFQFKHIGEEEGLEQKTIYAILQDSTGYLWLGTNDGLVRYDGYRFKTFRHNPDDTTSLSNNHINYLFEDSRGRLWVGTDGGLNYYNPNTESFVRLQTVSNSPDSKIHNTVFSITEDKNGSLWASSNYGVYRVVIHQSAPFVTEKSNPDFYDFLGKVQISHYVPKPHTNSDKNIIYKLLIDHAGQIWAGSYGGLMRLVPTTSNPNSKSSLTANYKYEMIYNRFDDKNNTLSGMILALLEDRNGTIWVQTSDALSGFSPDQPKLHLKSYHYDHGLFTIGALVEVPGRHDSKLWVNLKDNSFAIFDPNKETFTKIIAREKGKSNSTIPYYIHVIYKSRDGIYWFGTETGGLYKYDPDFSRFSQYNPKLNILISNRLIDMRFLFEDSHGVLWIANQGVYRCDRFTGRVLSQYWQNIKTQNWTFKNKICEDGLGNIWIGSEFGGLFRFEHQTQKMAAMLNYSPRNTDTLKELSATEKRTIFTLHDTPKNPIYKNIIKISENITAITKDARGNIWTGAGVDLLLDSLGVPNIKRFLNITHIDVYDHKIHNYNLSSLIHTGQSDKWQYIYTINAGPSGILWLGGSFGLFRFDPQTGDNQLFRAIPGDPHSLSGNRVQAVARDKRHPDRYLWVGTDGGGLCRFDKQSETFKRYAQKDGLPGLTVSSILTDRQDDLWLGTDKGLVHARIDSVTNDIARFISYDRGDGINDDDFSFFYGQNAQINAKGEMFFAGAKGISIFNPDSIRENTQPSKVLLTRFYLNFKPAEFKDPGSPLTAPLSRLKRIDLNHTDNSFAIEMATLDFHAPGKNRFAYKLDGYEDDWIYPGMEKRAIFTHVPPGTYTFRAIAAGRNGIRNEKETRLIINIIPPWYQSIWAYMLYLFIALGALAFAKNYENNRQRHKLQAYLQKQEAEKLKEMDILKTRFFTNISHEFRTPLALIKGPAEEELSSTRSSATRRRMQMIGRNVNRLMHLIGQLLDLNALETRHMALRAVQTDIIPFVQGLSMGFASWAERRNITLKVFSPEEKIDVCFDRDLMEKILNNLLSNAIKFSREKAGKIEIIIKLTDDDSCVQLIVKDNGIGIPEEKLAHVFDRFYQVDASMTREHEGSGIGLALVKELVELHKGRIEVESRHGLGTTFTITLPLGSDHLAPDQIMASVTESKRVNKVSANEYDFTHDTGQDHLDSTENSREEKPLLLIVEDHADFRRFMIDTLQNEYRIMEAAHGASGLKKALNKIPDLIISDVMMPKMNGYELCNKIKNDERTCHIPVILLTAKAATDDKLQGLGVGADDYLSKPFDKQELTARADNLITLRRKLRDKYGTATRIKPSEIEATSMDRAFLERIIATIEARMAEETFNSDVLAGEAAMSVSQLNRKLNALIGQPAGRLIRSMRLQRAADLLTQKASTVTEVCYAVGFSGQAHFSRAFKKQFGCSPSEYLKNR